MADPITLYKLIVLYMLKKIDFSMTNAQISNFILDQGYTTYFTLQSVLAELTEAIRKPFKTPLSILSRQKGKKPSDFLETKYPDRSVMMSTSI